MVAISADGNGLLGIPSPRSQVGAQVRLPAPVFTSRGRATVAHGGDGGSRTSVPAGATAAAIVVAAIQLRPRVKKAGRSTRAERSRRRAWEFVIDLPVPSPAELQAAASEVSEAAKSSVIADVNATSGRLAAELGSAASATPDIPPELQAQARELARLVATSMPELPPEALRAVTDFTQAMRTAVPPELAFVLDHPEVLEPVAMPAGAGALVVFLLWLRRGPQRWAEELPREYDYRWIEAYWQRRPLKLLSRFAEAGVKVGYYFLCLQLDEQLGKLEEMRPQRAVQARELITDLGVTFIKIAQVWASRPDVLPKEYIKEYEKLLEQVRPFGQAEALETLRRSEKDGVAASELFEDLSPFVKPVASASVGQVYKVKMGGRLVAVKVQRPDVREQSTLDLYVIRNAGTLGALLPFERLARQCKSLVELIDLTAPTFIRELDYEAEAANQKRFAETVEGCDLIRETVVVPEVVYSSKEVLVQEWLDGKKLTEAGAAKEQAGRVVKLLLNSYMVQFLETGFLHGDPHPGNFILMDTGKLGILDYGLMTSISPEKRLAFIEFLMHLQAKEYASCLQDLVNLDFFPAALAADKEARDVIVPTLASTLSTLYEEGGDLKKKQAMFKQQREAMKAAGKLDELQTQLREIAKKYSGAFRLPPYFTLILRAFSTLEGLGLKTDENFAIVKECFPYIARRLLTDDSFRMRESLKSYLYKGRRRIAVSRIDDLAGGFGKFTNLMKGSRDAASAAGGPVVVSGRAARSGPRAPAMATEVTASSAGGDGQPGVDLATTDIAQVIFSPGGNFLQDLLIDEGVAAVDALSRAVLVRLLRSLGPLALPVSAPLSLLLGVGLGDTGRIVTREDKEALLVLRRIVRLVQVPDRVEDDEATAERGGTQTDGNDLQSAAEALQRLQPIATGLLPAVTPGAVSFARRFLQQLARRFLLRVADDIEGGAGVKSKSLARAAAV